MKLKNDDCIIVERKVFLDLIAAAEGARAWMAHNCPAKQWENGVRQRLNEAILEAVGHHVDGAITLKSANDGYKHLHKK